MTSTSSRLDWRRPALALASTVVGLTVCEVVLRVAGVEPNAGRELQVKCEGRQRHDDWRCRHMFFQQDRFREDADLMWAPRAGARPFNSLGYRGPEVDEHKTPGTARVLAVGDSNTLGPLGVSWPDVLQDELGRVLGRPVEVLNGGVYGYTSYQGLRRLEQMIVYRPDVVLVSFGSNDALPTADLPDAAFAELSRSLHHGAERRFHLRTLEILTHWIRQHSGGRGKTPRVGLAEYRANLERMVAIAEAHGARAVLLTRPVIPQYCPMPTGEADWRKKMPLYNGTVMDVAEAEHVAGVDVDEHFAARRELFIDESHFTDGGSREMAALLLDTVLEALGEEPEPEKRKPLRAFRLGAPVEMPGGEAATPSAAMDPDGRIHVAWIETGAQPAVSYARVTGDGELAQVTRLAQTATPATGVALAIAESGRLSAAWADENGLSWTTSADGTRFREPRQLFAGRSPVAAPALAYEGDRSWLAWVEAGNAETGDAWVATSARSNDWGEPVRVGAGLRANMPVALISGAEPGEVWLAQCGGAREAPDSVALLVLRPTDEGGIYAEEPAPVGMEMPVELRNGCAPTLAHGTASDPLVVFISQNADTRRAFHTTSTCGPNVARPLGEDRGPQDQPTAAYVGWGMTVAAWTELSGPAPRLRIAYSENGGHFFSSGRPLPREPDTAQLSPSLASNGLGEAFALAYVRDDRCVVRRGVILNPVDH